MTLDSATITNDAHDIEKQEVIPATQSKISRLGLWKSLICLQVCAVPQDNGQKEHLPKKLPRIRSCKHSYATDPSTMHGVQSRKSSILITAVTKFSEGYPNLAAYHDSCEEFMVYRRFGYLFARVLLNKQDYLRRLEDELDEFDKANEDFAVTTQPNRVSKPVIEDRNALLAKIDAALSGYGRVKLMS